MKKTLKIYIFGAQTCVLKVQILFFPIRDPGTLEAHLKAATNSPGHSQERKGAHAELLFQDYTVCSFIP